MFRSDGIILQSGILDLPGIAHGFSTRFGGVSRLPYLASMNFATGKGDSSENVLKNTEVFVRKLSDGKYGAESVIVAPQLHSTIVSDVNEDDRGNGLLRASPYGCDGFITDRPGVIPIIRTADCVPILMAGMNKEGRPVVAALHAGWRGTAGGIVIEAVKKFGEYGVDPSALKASIGPHIGECCYEVGEDMKNEVASLRGREFADRHICEKEGKLYASLSQMNIELLAEAGVAEANIDVIRECTCCNNEKYHSYRKTGDKRGAMGSTVFII